MQQNFLLNLIAGLNKSQSKQQIKADTKSLGDLYVKLIGNLDMPKTRKAIKAQLKGLNNMTFNITPNVNTKGVQTATKQAINNAQRVANSNKVHLNFDTNKQQLINQIKILGRNNNKLFSDQNMTAKYNQLLNSASVAKSTGELKTLRGELSAFKTELVATNKGGMTAISKFQQSMSSYAKFFSGASMIYTLTNQLRNAATEAKTMDDSLVDLQKVTDEIADRDALYKYFDKSMSKAQELNVKVGSLIDAVTEFKKLGWSLDDAELGAKWANILANVGDVDIDTAIGSIKTSIASFDEIGGYTDDQMDKKLEAYTDLINNMSNKYSIDAEGLAESIRLSAGTLTEAHTSIEQAATMFATANKYYNDPSYLGNTAKIGSLRMRASSGDTDAIEELQEMGEEVDDLATATSNLRDKLMALTGVDIMVDDHTFKSYYDQLYEISQVMDQLDDTSRANVLETMFGKSRAAAGSALLSGMKESASAYEDAINSAGSATEEYQTWMTSADAACQRFSNTLTQTYQSIINGNTVRDLANLGSAVLEFANNWGIVEGTLKGVIALNIGKFIATGGMALITATKQVEQYGQALQMASNVPNGNLSARFQALKSIADATSSLTTEQLRNVLATNTLTQADRVRILQMQGMTKEIALQKLAEMNLTQATNAQTAANTASTASTFSLKAAMTGLGATLKSVFLSNPVGIVLMGISLGVSAVTSAVSKHNQAVEEARQKAKEAADTANTLGDEIATLANKYIQLSDAVKTDASAKEDLMTTQTELLKKLGLEGESIDDLIAKYGSLSNAIKQASIDSLKDQQIDLIAGVDAAREELIKAGKDAFGSDNWKKSIVAMGEEAGKAWQVLEDAGIISSGTHTDVGGEWFLSGDASEQGVLENYKTIENALEALRDSNKFTQEELSQNDLFKELYERYNTVKEAAESYDSEIENLNENLAQQTTLTALQGSEIPKTEEDFNTFKQELIDTAVASKQFIGNEKEITDAINNYLSTVPEFEGYYSIPLENELDKVDALLSQEDFSKTSDIFELNNSDNTLTELGKINEELDKFQSAYTTLKETMDSYNETGTFTLDQVQGIISLGDEYLKYLMDENGELQLNEEALNNVAVARINEMRAKALSNLMDNLENIKSETDALEYLKTQNLEVAASYDALTESKIRAWADHAIGSGMSENTVNKVVEVFKNQVSDINEMFDNIDLSSIYTKSSSAAKTSTSETLNWVQTLISRVQHSISNLGNAVSATYKKWTARNNSLKAELSSVRKEISLQQTAYEAYLKKADSIKLSDHYKSLVQNGGLAIEDIANKTLREQVKTYQEWYEKALDCADAVSKLNDKLADLAKTKFDNISAQYDSKIQDIDHSVNVIQNKLKEVELFNNIAGESFYDALLENEQIRIQILNNEYNEKVAAFNEAVRNGIETGSEMWQNMKSDIDEVYESIQQANNQIVEYKNSLKEIAKLKFDSINEQFDNAVGLLDSEIGKIDKEIQLIEQAGYTASNSFYNKLVEAEKTNVESLIEQYEDLSSAFNEGLASGSIQKYDDNWYDMVGSITEVENALLDSQTALIEYGNALRELDWSAFDRMQQSISNITSESDFFVSLLSGKDLYNENGTYTDEGLAVRGLHAINYDTYLRQAKEYKDVISDISKEIANDPANNTLIERYEELCNLQKEAIQNAQDEKDAIIDLASNGYDKLLSYFDDLISARKNALKSASDLHDYENTISKQTASIEQYRKQLAAYSGDDSEDMRATIQKVQQNLTEAEKELAETEYDKYISDQEMLLDTFSNELQEWVNTRLDDVNGLFRTAIEQTNLNADKISDVISSISVEFGVSLESLSSILKNTDYSGGMKDIVSGFYGDGGEFSTKMTAVENCINEIKDNKIPSIGDINSVIGNNFSDFKNDIPNLETTNNKLSDIESVINTVRKAIESISNTVTEYEAVNQDYVEDTSGNSYDFHDEYTVSNVEINNYNGDNTQKETQKTTKKTSAGGFGGKKSLDKTMLIEGGYAKGTTNAKKGYHTVAENGEEIIFGDNGAILVDGQQLYPFRGGETVLNNDEVSNLYKLSKLPAESVKSLLNLNANSMMANLSKIVPVPSPQNTPGNSEIKVEINNSFPGIKNYDEFLSKIQSDRKAERIIQNIVTDKMLGKNSYNKLKF